MGLPQNFDGGEGSILPSEIMNIQPSTEPLEFNFNESEAEPLVLPGIEEKQEDSVASFLKSFMPQQAQAAEPTPEMNPRESLLADYRDRLAKAEESRSGKNLAAIIAQSGQQLSNAVSQAYGGQGFGQTSPIAQFLMQEGDRDVAKVRKELEDQEKLMDLQNKGTEMDPASPVSKSMQDLAKKLSPSTDFSGLSAQQLQKIFPQLTAAYNAEQMRLARTEARKIASSATEKREVTPFEKKQIEGFAKAAVQYDTVDRPQLQGNLTKLDFAIDKLEKGKEASGLVTGRLPDVINQIVAPQAVPVRESIQSAIQETLRPTLGAQFTEKEGERIMNLQFNPTLPEEENKRRAQELRKVVQRKIDFQDAFFDHLRKGGTTSDFDYAKYGMRGAGQPQAQQEAGQTVPQSDIVTMRAPDGSTARVKRDQVQKYLDRGAVIVNE